MKSPVTVRDAGGYRVWSMDFAPVNALSPELLGALDAELDSALADESTAAIVLTSGLKVFSAGADATWMGETAQARGVDGLVEEFIRTMDTFRALCERMRRSPLLFVGVLGGHTLAGGLELAAACDIRYAADNEKIRIGVPEMDLFGAMPSGGGGVQYLTRLMGASRALHFVLDAKPVNPQQAYAAGLVDRLVAPEELLGEAEAFARSVADKAGRIGVGAAKRAIFGGGEQPLSAALELDRALHWDAVRRGNFRRGVEAFVQQFASGGKGR
jgi:enoyl-CoA hydratase/carnithine racemase